MALNIYQGSSGHGLFDRAEDGADLVIRRCRPKYYVSMFGHDDIRPQTKLMFGPGTIQRLNQPCSTSVPVQKRLPAKAGESDRMNMPGDVVTLARFSVRHGMVRIGM